MNETPDRHSWQNLPPERAPVLPLNSGRALWSHSGGYTDEFPDRVDESRIPFENLKKYLWIFYRHRWVALGIVVATVALGLIYTLLSTPLFMATATIQIDKESAKVVNLGNVQAQVGDYTDYDSDAFYATQYEIIKSHSLAQQIASSLSVDELQQFTQAKVLSRGARLRELFARIFGLGKRAEPSGEDLADVDVSALQEAAAYKVQGSLSVQPVGTSRIVRLNFVSPNPGLAQRMANAVANTFVALTLQRRFQASSYARNFLEDRLKEIKVKLEDSEAQLVAYAQAQGIVNVDEKQSLVSADLEELNSELAKTGRERLKAEQLLQQAEATDGLALPQILNDTSVRNMRDRRTDLLTQYHDQLAFFKPDYPDMLKIKAQINELDSEIRKAVDIVKQSLKADYEAAKSQEEALNRKLGDLKKEVLDLDSRGIQYRILQREVDTNRQLYDGLLQQFKEVGVAGAVGTNNVSIVDPAELPGGPVSPKLSKNLMIAFAFGLFCAGIAATGLEYLDDTFKVPEDLESSLGLPVLGIIPIAFSAEVFKKEFGDPRSSMSEAYRSLRTALQFSTTEGVPKTLLVTSARPGEGKSTTATALARNFAGLGLKVLLVDADLRNPSLHKIVGSKSSVGLSNYLTGNGIPHGAFQDTDQEGLTFMATGPLPPNPAELLAGPKMPSLLNIAGERFDLVVVDGPPVMGIADAPLLASIAGGTLLVVEAGSTRRGVTKAALKRLHFARAQMLGVLLNKFNARDVGHTYGYGYGGADYYGYGAEVTPEQIEQGRQQESA